jgi:hypothetical protein
MAKRIHVFAIRNTAPEVVREALTPLGNPEVNNVNGWCWFSSSVWGVASSKILEALQDLDGPLMLVTTEDACRWYLRLRQKGREAYIAMHEIPPCSQDEDAHDYNDFDLFNEEFEEDEESGCVEVSFGTPPIPESALSPLTFTDPFFEPYVEEYDEDDEEEEEYDDSPLGELCESYASLGLPLSDALIERLRAEPDDKVQEAFRETHADEMQNALVAFGIPHDRHVVLDVLMGRTVTSVELDWDIGNLPRFLAALGLGEHFDKMVTDAEIEERQLAEAEPENYAEGIVKKMATAKVTALTGGPLRVPMADVHLLFRAGYYTHKDMEAAFSACLPKGTVFSPPERVPSYLSVRETEGRLDIGCSSNDVFLVPASCAKLAKLLGALPNGTSLALHLKSDVVPSQQFQGTIQGEAWCLESSAPPLSATSLAEAIELFRDALAKQPLIAENDAEARAILEAAKTDYVLHDLPITQDGLTFTVARRWFNALATLFFRHRFGHLWDCSVAITEDKQSVENWRAFNQGLEESERLPVHEEVFLEGRATKIYEADMEAASRDEELTEEIKKLPARFKALAALGFDHLGNLVCEKVGKCVICAFANADESAFMAHYVWPYGTAWQDCFTPFKDGTSLTTTNGMNEGSITKLRILAHTCESKAPKKLMEAHRTGMDILKKQGIEEVRFNPSLEGFAQSLDDFLVKRLAEE